MTSSTTKRVAILGAGMIGEVHRRAAVLAGAQVVGVMASSPERSREVAAAWGAEQAYANIDEVAASDVGFNGDLCVEREAGTTRVDDIAAARTLVEGIQ